MSDTPRPFHDSPTLDTSPPEQLPEATRTCRPVALVEGSGPEMTTETQQLLRSRLRAVTLIYCFGFAMFLIKNLIITEYSKPVAVFLLIFHAVVTFILGLGGMMLCRNCEICLRRMRIMEVVIFGLPVLFFLTTQSLELLKRCRELAPYQLPFREEFLHVWFIMMFIYALFIPSSARRTVVVAGAMALAPMILLLVMVFNFEVVAQAVEIQYLISVALFLSIGVFACSVGTHTIGTLRREAFEAKRLGQYRLRHLLGTGGMGEVYLAEHQLMKRPCAIKLIRPSRASDPIVLARFEREVQATAKLSHFNNIDIFDYGHTDDGTFYYVMEYLPGMSLSELVERHGPLPAARVIHLLRQTCNALEEAHSVELVHRDIKPANIFSAYRGGIYDVVKLLDFGLVKPLTDVEDMELTREGAITGSPLYMAPEQATGDSTPDARSDIYSLGAVAYFLLTGRPPFERDKPIKVILAHAHEAVIPPSQIQPEIPEDLERVILRCLSKAPSSRFLDVVSLNQSLDECEQAGQWTRQDAARWWMEHNAHVSRPPAEPDIAAQTQIRPVY